MARRPRSWLRRYGAQLACSVWLVILLAVTIYTGSHPIRDWDVLAYAGLARSFAGEVDPARIQQQAYEDVRETATVDEYQDLLGATTNSYMNNRAYRAAVAGDPVAFAQQLPFYKVKPLLPILMLAVSQAGMTLTRASELISAASYAVLGLLMFAWLWDRARPWWTLAIAGALVLSPPFLSLGRIETPDALSAAFLIGGLYLIARARRPRTGTVVLLAAILARPNNAALVVLVLVYLGFVVAGDLRLGKRFVGSMLAVVFVVYVVVSAWSQNYPYSTLFYFANIAYLPYPASGPPSISLTDYLHVYVSRFRDLLVTMAPIYTVLGALAIRLRAQDRLTVRSDLLSGLAVVVLLAMAIQWVYYPVEADRILAGDYLALAVILGAAVNVSRDTKGRDNRALANP